MWEIPIERGKVREFTLATHTESADHLGADAVIPGMFLTTGMMVWAPQGEGMAAGLGFELARVLHGEEEYTFHGPPPRAGSSLRAESKIADRFEKEGKRGGTMRFTVVVTEFHDDQGTLVAEQRSTLVETAQPPKES